MRVDIRDADALRAVSPAALRAYAIAAGWSKLESYGDHSDVYAGDEVPEILLPRTELLGDYASVVSRLITTFARLAATDELSLYRDLVTANRDVVRVQVGENDDGSVSVEQGVDLVTGARDLLLAAACALHEPQPLYRAGANQTANELLDSMRLGQTEHSSFVVALWTPIVPLPLQIPLLAEHAAIERQPAARRLTYRLTEALKAVRTATEYTIEGNGDAFIDGVEQGISANLCEALVKLIGSFLTLDVSVTWARTRPMPSVREVVRFARSDTPVLLEAARLFRLREPQFDSQLFGFVQRLKRNQTEDDGAITLNASLDGRRVSVTVVLRQSDYERAIRAHGDKALVGVRGDLERAGQRWRLLNARVTDVIRDPSIDDSSE